jgi:hypothetical protein
MSTQNKVFDITKIEHGLPAIHSEFEHSPVSIQSRERIQGESLWTGLGGQRMLQARLPAGRE